MHEVNINDILYAVITVAVPLILRYLYQLVSAKVADCKYAEAVNAVGSAVLSVSQTYVDTLKAAGCFDAAAQQTAFEKAKDAALEAMEDSTRKWLERSFSDLDAWFTVQIESAVKKSKKEGNNDD